MINAPNGFYAGKRAFSEIARASGVDLSGEIKIMQISYKGYLIFLDNHLQDHTIIGIGDPYATIAKIISDSINK